MRNGLIGEQNGLRHALKLALVLIAAFTSAIPLVSAVRGDFALSLAASIVITAVAALSSGRRAELDRRVVGHAVSQTNGATPAAC
ncbi:hypothetical protein ACMGDM_19610 [Sphingomonas sp. DT-51]|uniref:hypothetical protein n=1 Tax=Sphingomonas sp. DT-51 TaxID=3396165 RepID=UPI003F1E0454